MINLRCSFMKDWAEVNAELKPWKETGTFVVSGGCVDEIQ